MWIKELLGPANLLGLRAIKYLLTNHRFLVLMIYTMNGGGEMIKEACETNFGTPICKQKIA